MEHREGNGAGLQIRRLRRRWSRAVTSIAVVAGMTGCGGETPRAPDLRFDEVRVRPAAISEADFGTANSAAYLRIRNLGTEGDRLIGADFDGARRVEVHETRIGDDGLAMMRPIEFLPIPPGAEVRLKPGGVHVMLMGLERPLVAGEDVELSLTFEISGVQRLIAEIR
ncbi:MAG: copper chaperone PCu(A)C [Gemmatimonadota bacterium]|jgi:copper(I)-binding protein